MSSQKGGQLTEPKWTHLVRLLPPVLSRASQGLEIFGTATLTFWWRVEQDGAVVGGA